MTRLCSIALFALAALAAAAPATAQDFRGGIRGTVADATGGVLPGVTVTVTNAATGVSQTIVTDDKGLFEVLYLNGGTYTVEGRALRLQDRRPQRQRGARRRRAAARADAVDRRREETVRSPPTRRSSTPRPGSAARPSTPSRSPSCRSATARPTCSRAWRRASWIRRTCISRVPPTTATSPASSPTACRGATSSRIDGAPNMSNARGVGFSPPSDAIAQFKVQTNAFDAQTGHTAGAVVNLALKSGTNALQVRRQLLQPQRQPLVDAAPDRRTAGPSRRASTTATPAR